ncbi:hypothetical protein D3C80_1516840 [compost metagenome]
MPRSLKNITDSTICGFFCRLIDFPRTGTQIPHGAGANNFSVAWRTNMHGTDLYGRKSRRKAPPGNVKGLAGYRPARRPDHSSLANCDTVAPAPDTSINKTHTCPWARPCHALALGPISLRTAPPALDDRRGERAASDRGGYSDAGLQLGGVIRRFRQVGVRRPAAPAALPDNHP